MPHYSSIRTEKIGSIYLSSNDWCLRRHCPFWATMKILSPLLEINSTLEENPNGKKIAAAKHVYVDDRPIFNFEILNQWIT